MSERIIILGAGPTGLGAAWRLQELCYDNFLVLEKQDHAGGLAYSFVDDNGFTWDIGGHVQFSHYSYFDNLMDSLLPSEWLTHQRESWVWIKDRFVPYPFQNNIKYLPKDDVWKSLSGLIAIYKNPHPAPKNFRDWIYATFGDGIAELFMVPYNFKVWAYPAEKLSFSWIGERVAVTDLARVTQNVLFDKDDLSWGPNNTFRFPLRGGTGAIWSRLFARINQKNISLNSEIVAVDTKKKCVHLKDGGIEVYDKLISTIPLDIFLRLSDISDKSAADLLMHSSTHVIGLGLHGRAPAHLQTKCWMYFPETNCPFYRVTVFSNYSPNNVPDISRQWSLMFEVSESKDKQVNHKTIVEETIAGALATGLIKSRDDIIDVFHHFEAYGYPTPSLHRDEALSVLKDLEKVDVFSRGRFGAWKYEVSNQDHSLMQGVEIANRLVNGEEELTVWSPSQVNSGKKV